MRLRIEGSTEGRVRKGGQLRRVKSPELPTSQTEQGDEVFDFIPRFSFRSLKNCLQLLDGMSQPLIADDTYA